METNLRVTTLGEIWHALDDFRHLLELICDAARRDVTISDIITTEESDGRQHKSPKSSQQARLRRTQQHDWPRLHKPRFLLLHFPLVVVSA